MEFDQNSIPKDLRPSFSKTRTVPEEPRIALVSANSTVTATTAVRSPEFFAGAEGSLSVFYPATVADAGFVGLGYGNNPPPPGIAQWGQVLPVPIGSVNAGLNAAAAGFGYGPNLGNMVVGNAVDNSGFGNDNDLAPGCGSDSNLGNRVNANGSGELTSAALGYNPGSGNRGSGGAADHGCEEGGDDWVSGKKVKFLCSFGGKILPRPSDGMLRYVGGQTRILSVRRDGSFSELVQKMVDTYGQPVIIKYQLPDEDLDALVSVSCPDDLDNMMEEYEKLVERSSDGSAKLRVFLFSAMELDASGMSQYGDSHDSGQRYVDAVNGITDGVGSLIRKESIASATSTQNSDFSGTEAVDVINPAQGDVIGPPSTSMLSTGGNLSISQESSPKLVLGDPNRTVYPDASAVSLGIPVVKSGPPHFLYSQSEVELERSVPATLPEQQWVYDFQQAGMCIPSSAPNLPAYVDSRQEIKNHVDYVSLPSQMGFPDNQLLGAAGSVLTQPQICDGNIGVVPHQFIPALHVTMTPSSSQAAMRPTAVQPLIRHQQTQLEQCTENGTFGARIVQLPVDPNYHAYRGHLPPAIVGGYGWHQVSQPDNIVFPDVSMPYQQVISRLEDCYMCHKTLPHAHSDPVAWDKRESGASNMSDSNSVHHSLRMDDTTREWPVNRVMAIGAWGGSNIENSTEPRHTVLSHVDHQVRTPHSEGIVFSQKLGALRESERIALQKVDNSDQPKVSVAHGLMGLPGDLQSPYGVFAGAIPRSHQEDSVQHQLVPSQYQVMQEALLSKPIISNAPPVTGVPIQVSECHIHNSLKECSGKLPRIVSKEDIVNLGMLYNQLTPTDGMIETVLVLSPEVNVINEAKKPPIDKLGKEDILDQTTRKMAEGEVLLDNTFNKPHVVLDANHIKHADFQPVSTEVPCVHNSQPMEAYEVAQPILGNPTSYPQTNIGVHLLDSDEVSNGNPAVSSVQPSYIIDGLPPVAELKNDALWLESKIFPGDTILDSNANTISVSPALGTVAKVQDSSNSLFSNQDPWNLRHDSPFPPPKPNKIAIRKETFGAGDPFSENYFANAEELNKDLVSEDALPQPLSNSNKDVSSENAQLFKDSSEDLIKQELQAVAEDVAASVFKSATPNPDFVVHEGSESAYEAHEGSEVSNKDVETQHKAKFEDMKNKMPEKVNFGFPVSEGIGRLQIIKNSDLEELRELGSGTFGTVYHGKWRGTDVAIKRINDRCFAGKPSEQERMIDDFWNEAIKLADLHHPNVVAFYGVVLDGPGKSVATVTEYMVNGSLRNALQKNERIPDKRKRLLIAMDVAFGMEYLHGKNIVHFDLKSDNLLVNLRDPHRPICKVGDLGLSKVKCQTLISGGVRGTLPWMAPELLNGGSSLVSEKVDVFSFGIVMWELLTGEEPYADLHYGAIIGGIVSNTLRPQVPDSCDTEWRSLMERCWSSEPSERPSFTIIANDLRAMAARIPSKGQNAAHQVPSTQVQKKI